MAKIESHEKTTKSEHNPSESYDLSHLNFLRSLIDNIDSAIMAILAHRGQVVNFIIEYKAVHQIASSQSEMRQKAIDDLLEFSAELQLRKDFIKQLLEHLFSKSSTFLHCETQAELHTLFSQKKNMLLELNRTLKHLDMALCSLLSERMQLVRQVGEFKAIHGISPLAKGRWEEVLKSKMNMAKNLKINPDAICEFYNLIHEEALSIESNLKQNFEVKS